MKKIKNSTQVISIIKEIEAANRQRPLSSTNKRKFPTVHSRFLPEIDKEEVRQQVRERIKRKWKDSGYPAGEFQRPLVLKAKVLDAWDMQRVHLSKRSYEFPKGFKGMRVSMINNVFPAPTLQGLPQKTAQYVKKCEDAYIDAMYDPRQVLKTYESKMVKVLQDHKSIFKRTNTVQNEAFGYNRVVSRSLSQAALNKRRKL